MGALRELESAGYIVRHQMRDRQGRISDTEYVIYEQPQPQSAGYAPAGYGFTRLRKTRIWLTRIRKSPQN